MKKLFFTSFLISLLAIGISWAQQPARVPAYRGVIERVQPDGDTLHIYLRGDERYHYSMTLDGWQIIENEQGTLCYALLQKDGMVIASKKQAHDADKRKCCETRWLKRKGILKIKDER